VSTADVEGLLRDLAPRALGAVVRRFGDFADAEDAIQEALLAAAQQWPRDLPTNPLGWLVTVASRRLIDEIRAGDARRRREDTIVLLDGPTQTAEQASSNDDSLVLLFLCCHAALSPTLAIPLTLRAVAGLTTREIAAAYLVPEATMAQRISRAKAKLRGERFAMPEDPSARLPSVLEVLYLLFNEGYASSSGPDLARVDLSAEAIRLARLLHEQLPDDAEVTGLLALMLLTDARRLARTGASGELVPLAEQDRRLWDRGRITEGMVLLTDALKRRRVGEYQLLAAIAGLHDQAPSSESTQWPEIASLYGLLERMTGNPVVTLNRAVAVAMVDGPRAGLQLLDGLRLDTHRVHAVRGHLLEQAGELAAAAAAYTTAAGRATNVRERDYLTMRAAHAATAGYERGSRSACLD
jgi:RNA polymerase sigma factor (sigma-70 family)